MATIPRKVIDRFTKQLGTYQKVLQNAKDRDVNESDTVTIITDILAGVFGFDKYTEVTSEQAIRGTFCDLAVKLDDKINYLIEVKAIGLDLKENHLRQAVNYGANHGIDWVVLTNGVQWEIYRLRFERPIAHDLVCSFNILELNPRQKDDQARLYLLCKEGISKEAIEEFHQQVQLVNKFIIGAMLLTEPVINVIRREMRKMADGVKVTSEDIERVLVSDVLKREIVEGESVKEAKKRISKALNKIARKKKKAEVRATSTGSVEIPQATSPDT